MSKINSLLITAKTRVDRIDGIVDRLTGAPEKDWNEACRRMWRDAAEFVDALPDKNPSHLVMIAEFIARISKARLIRALAVRMVA